ncbi:hypothetical protein [Methylovulum psychrotolerans]|uniref:DNA-binding protein n=1 Tax=Methylovulum psychrotolerans TaxID=1704499 RepID=A0A1Z4C0G4_9GAMM|nr:hypothetical protein [Methylovulum psychrotolerans]ASF47027.1 hypothetical protein CEK71_13620 [Methylovulum psychrotolerans]
MQVTTGKPLVDAVRAGFVLKGTSFNRYCLDTGVDPSYARRVLMGITNGSNGLELVAKLIEASNAQPATDKDCEDERQVA